MHCAVIILKNAKKCTQVRTQPWQLCPNWACSDRTEWNFFFVYFCLCVVFFAGWYAQCCWQFVGKNLNAMVFDISSVLFCPAAANFHYSGQTRIFVMRHKKKMFIWVSRHHSSTIYWSLATTVALVANFFFSPSQRLVEQIMISSSRNLLQLLIGCILHWQTFVWFHQIFSEETLRSFCSRKKRGQISGSSSSMILPNCLKKKTIDFRFPKATPNESQFIDFSLLLN